MVRVDEAQHFRNKKINAINEVNDITNSSNKENIIPLNIIVDYIILDHK